MTRTRAAALAVAMTLVACGPSVPAPATTPAVPPPASPSAAPVSLAPAAPVATPDTLPGLDALAARGPSVAAGMREVARGDLTTAGGSADRSIAQAGADTCVRVAMAAQPAVHAWLADSRGNRLTDEPDASSALLGALGPVCVRKGDAVTLHVEAHAPYVARFVAWASP